VAGETNPTYAARLTTLTKQVFRQYTGRVPISAYSMLHQWKRIGQKEVRHENRV